MVGATVQAAHSMLLAMTAWEFHRQRLPLGWIYGKNTVVEAKESIRKVMGKQKWSSAERRSLMEALHDLCDHWEVGIRFYGC